VSRHAAMFRCCDAQSISKLRENPNRRGFAGYPSTSQKSLGQDFVIRQRMQNEVIRYIIATDLNGRETSAAGMQNANATHIVSLYSSPFQETP
jgi:hypothetical protein